MSAFFIFGALLGAVLGLRCKVATIVPVIIIMAGLLVLFELQRELDFLSMALRLLVLCIVVQSGYFGTACLRGHIAAARISRRRGWRTAARPLIVKND
jgi:hypothetical protein